MNKKQISNPFSTGGGGTHFETNVQASFVALMLAKGSAPGLQVGPIVKIKLQGRFAGYNTDDLIVFIEDNSRRPGPKLLGQVKHSLSISERNTTFKEVIDAAWVDFNNSDLFTKNRDIIALITGPLSATDTFDVRTILDWSRWAENSQDFFGMVEEANFSSAAKRKKLNAFKAKLNSANGGKDVPDEIIFQFLRHFHLLGYDLDIKSGVTLSLVHSLIGQYSREKATSIWGRLIEEVQSANQNAGTIVPERLPEDIIDAFHQPAFTSIPKELINVQSEPEKTNWAQHQHASDLALMNLVGRWNDKNQSDLQILNNVSGQKYKELTPKAREILLLSDSLISLRNGHWKITERANLLEELGSRIFDDNLDFFKESVVTVLAERDPSFELPAAERYAASLHGKTPTYSADLREGLAEGLALLGSRPGTLINCSQNKVEDTCILAIREIFENADWVTWGSLNNLLPLLAESAPVEFLDTVENALCLSPCPFDELFSQEGSGIMGGNYLTGLLWALEALAWNENYLVRVCVILGELSAHDPGGTWGNRPANSLTTILLPWFPQTMASISKRKAAVKTLCKEWPAIAWQLIISLLPGQYRTSSGTHKPFWRNSIPVDLEERVSRKDYSEQVLFYSGLAISMAANDAAKLAKLIAQLGDLPKPSFNKLIEILSSDAISELHEDKRQLIWDKLNVFVLRNRRFTDAKWTLPDELLTLIEKIADQIAPSNPFNLYQHLFTGRDYELYEENCNWDEQRGNLQDRKQTALKHILDVGGIELVLEFVEIAEAPNQIGKSLGGVADETIDALLLPKYLATDDSKLSIFISAFVWSSHSARGWCWVDAQKKDGWSSEQIGRFLSCLPFTSQTWSRVEEWISGEQCIYWDKTNVYPYETDDDLSDAIDKLIEHGRPHAAIYCLDWMRHEKKPISIDQCVSALLAGLSSSESPHTVDTYHIVELIKMLQELPEINSDDLFHIEWAYLSLIDGHSGITPTMLENQLSNVPEFFHEVISLVYRSKNADIATDELSEEQKEVAANAWRLLHVWSIPPGMQKNGKFKEDDFLNWLYKVKEICKESGHMDVALINVGSVLIYSPPETNGLWINRTVAEALNAKDVGGMRSGYRTALYNSRGAHTVDPTGKPELKLAEHYTQKANKVENEGFQRLANTLRKLSASYAREAERVIAEYGSRDVNDA